MSNELDRAVATCTEELRQSLDAGVAQRTALEALAAALMARFRASGANDDIEQALSFQRQALELCPISDADHARFMADLGFMIFCHFEKLGHREDLEEAIQCKRKALNLLSTQHPQRGEFFKNLAVFILTRFEQQGDLDDLDEAITLHREALALQPTPHPNRSSSLNNLGKAINTRFEQRGDPADIDEAVTLHREALGLVPTPHPDRGSSLNNLAFAIWTRFRQRGDPLDIDEAITLHREALALRPTPHPERGGSLNNLGKAISSRFKQWGNSADIDEAVTLHREALALLPTPHPARANSLNNLAVAIYTRFQQRGDPVDLDEAVTLYHEALALQPTPHPNRGNSLNNIGLAIYTRFQMRGDLVDLNEAITLHREALVLRPTPHPNRWSSLNNLGLGIRTRFEHRGDPTDIDEAVLLHREALALQPTPHPQRGGSLNNLAIAIQSRFEQRGDPDDIDETLLLHREALSLRPTPHPERHSSLNNLANAVWIRFQMRGDLVDIDEAIALHREALALRPGPHPERGKSLNNLALAIQSRFERGKSLNNLALAIQSRFEQRGDPADIDEAVLLHREALTLQPTPHPERADSLNNLALAMWTQFQQQGDLVNIDEVITLHRAALALRPTPHSKRVESLCNLGNSLISVYEQSGTTTDLASAVLFFREGSTDKYGPLPERLRTARSWSSAAHKHCHPSASEAYETAIALLPNIAALGLSLRTRQAVLVNRRKNLSQDAAACAIDQSQYNTAVELLEAGSSVFWSQCLQLRTPLDDLRISNPILAAKLTDLARQLEQSSFREESQSPGPVRDLSAEAEGVYCQSLNREWDETVQYVRSSVPGFEDFMQFKKYLSLRDAAKRGPVVVLTAGDSGCHALILESLGGVQCVHLPPSTTRASVNTQARILQALISSRGSYSAFIAVLNRNSKAFGNPDRLLGSLEGGKDFDPEARFRQVLEILWTDVVHPVLARLKIQKSDDPPRIWWCPTGSFAFLPIHAAGVYNENSTPEWVGDYVISSYTPTLAALIQAPLPKFTPSNPMSATVIIQPDTPGCSPLPQTVVELRRIEETIPVQWLTTFGTLESPASAETVLPHLQTSSIIHFACHGIQDIQAPLKSALMVGNDRVTVSQIMKQSGAASGTKSGEEERMGLAFLSACETAMGDEKLPDESIHLAATLLFAGFRSVVATMWSVLLSST
ncbi:CHAT domain-containing protein [Mycena leptocephala]|nr:CHAT domain-containing protein [Mycena leptocephala]